MDCRICGDPIPPENATQPDTSRNRPAGAPLRPPVIDGIEEHDPTGRIEELDQDSKLDNALHIEELDRAGQHRGARLSRIRHAIISFGLPIEPEDSQYGESRVNHRIV